MRSNLLFLTAGFGDSDHIAASDRLQAQAVQSGLFQKSVAIKFEDLEFAAPNTLAKYAKYLSQEHKGFGYFCWKAEIINSGLQGVWGDFDGVVWADAGCEIFSNPISRLRFRRLEKIGKRNGVFCFTLNYPESDYTKRSLFKKFPDISYPDLSPQVQATWLIFQGEIGKGVCAEWFDVSIENIRNLDLENEGIYEVDSFVEHRFDQSILSLVIKNRGIKISKYVPAACNRKILSQIRGTFHPIWTSRNRSGKSLKYDLIRKIFFAR